MPLPHPSSSNISLAVGVIMGSQSDWDIMSHSADILKKLDISHEVKIVSAHRTPDRLREYAISAVEREIGRASCRERV